jgi:hypothetical protein
LKVALLLLEAQNTGKAWMGCFPAPRSIWEALFWKEFLAVPGHPQQ